jgi:hypothetical protein
MCVYCIDFVFFLLLLQLLFGFGLLIASVVSYGCRAAAGVSNLRGIFEHHTILCGRLRSTHRRKNATEEGRTVPTVGSRLTWHSRDIRHRNTYALEVEVAVLVLESACVTRSADSVYKLNSESDNVMLIAKREKNVPARCNCLLPSRSRHCTVIPIVDPESLTVL